MAGKPLQEFVEEVGKGSHLRVEHDFGDGYVRLRTSEAERRQAAQDIRSSEDILIELLRNARDAHASHIYVAIGKSGTKRTIIVIDDGDGIPASMHRHIFEPRVTSKLDTAHHDKWGMHGRGMALFSVSENAQEARVVASAPSEGASIKVVSDTSVLSEKADQSSFPTFLLNDQGTVDVRGPKNLLRTACEFAIEERASCSVAIGSVTEILAALHSYGIEHMSDVDRLFCQDADARPLVQRLATASDSRAVATIAADLGLEVSERTARRIMDGEVDSAESLLETITIQDGSAKGKGRAKGPAASAHPRVRLAQDESDRIAEAALEAYRAIAARYYLDGDVEPTVRVGSAKITVSIPIVHE